MLEHGGQQLGARSGGARGEGADGEQAGERRAVRVQELGREVLGEFREGLFGLLAQGVGQRGWSVGHGGRVNAPGRGGGDSALYFGAPGLQDIVQLS